MTFTRTFVALVLCGSMLAAGAAKAVPAAAPLAGLAGGSSPLSKVYYRGYGRYGGYRGGYYRGGRWIGLGIGAAIVGSAIVAENYRYRRYRDDSAVERCADTYRSFDPRSGTYMGYDGERHTCPYLR